MCQHRSLLLLLAGLAVALHATDFRPPAGIKVAARRPGAESTLPGGRMIDPLGRGFTIGAGAFGLALSPDGKYAVTANGGPERFSLSVLDMSSNTWQATQLRARLKDEERSAGAEDDGDWRSVFMGLAFAEERRLYASEGNSGRVREIAIPSGHLHGLFVLDQGPWHDSYSGDLAYDAARHLLYVVDQANFRVAIFNTRTRKLLGSVRTGRLPFRLALSPDRNRLYVANLGMFEYKAIPGASHERPQATGLSFPAFGFPSKQAVEGVMGTTAGGNVDVPGLGDPNAPESNSLSVIDVTDPASARVEAFVRTGEPFGPNSLGGSGPTAVVATAGSIYVANGNQDTISIVDSVTLTVREQIPLRIPELEHLRGILPLSLALDTPNGRLYVAEAGINAVGVVDLSTNRLVGHIPAAWSPAALALNPGRVFVANAKGLRHRPKRHPHRPARAQFSGRAPHRHADRLRHAPAAPHADVDAARVHAGRLSATQAGAARAAGRDPPRGRDCERESDLRRSLRRHHTGLQRRGQRRPRSGPPGAARLALA